MTRDALIQRLATAGLCGLDENDLLDELAASVLLDGRTVLELLDELRADGIAEDVACSWVRLAPAWWVEQLQQRFGMSEGVADRVIALLDGRPIVDAEIREEMRRKLGPPSDETCR